jgi:DNA-binding MarR family transcriptional regulator
MDFSPFRQTLRELVRCYQAIESYANANIREFELTTPQFDVLTTLAEASSHQMTPKELAEQTWITKGTLTGVIDRLAVKGLVERLPSMIDGRSQFIALTQKGQQLIDDTLPAHLSYMSQAFAGLSSRDCGELETLLSKLRACFDRPSNRPK